MLCVVICTSGHVHAGVSEMLLSLNTPSTKCKCQYSRAIVGVHQMSGIAGHHVVKHITRLVEYSDTQSSLNACRQTAVTEVRLWHIGVLQIKHDDRVIIL